MPSPVSAEMRTGRRSPLGSSRLASRWRSSAVKKVGLVPDLDDPRCVVRVDAEFAQDDVDVARLRLRFAMRDVADVEQHVGLDHVFERRAEGRDEHGRKIGDEADRVGEDDLLAVRQVDRPRGRIEGGEQHVLGQHVGRGQAVEERRLAGIGVADQRDDRIGHPPPARRGAGRAS